MAETEQFLQSVFALMQFKVQPLLALLAEAFSELDAADEKDASKDECSVDNSKTMFRKKLDQLKMKDPGSFKRMIKNCKKNIPDEGHINILSLDVHFLLKLMIETKFLGLPDSNKEKCSMNHGDKCCSSCDHTQDEKKCKGCKTPEKHCGITCCKHCNVCYECYHEKLRVKLPYMNGKKSLDELIQNLRICWVFLLKKSLPTLMKCRNLVHETSEKIKPFFAGESNCIGNFKDMKNVDQLCRDIHFSTSVLCMVLMKSIPFKKDIQTRAKEMKQEIDEMFVYTADGKCQLARPSQEELKAYIKYVVSEQMIEEFEKRNKEGVYLFKNRKFAWGVFSIS